MMNEKQGNSFEISQNYNVIPPKRGNAYPILCEEWKHLKEQVGNIKTNFKFYHSFGSILLGAGVTTFISILLGVYSKINPANPNTITIAWAIAITATFLGVICLFFANESLKLEANQTRDIVKQMELIEKRYQIEDAKKLS